MTNDNVVAMKILQDDPEMLRAIANSEHPACVRLTDFLANLMMSIRHTGGYVWPGTQQEMDNMVRDAVRAVQRAQIRLVPPPPPDDELGAARHD